MQNITSVSMVSIRPQDCVTVDTQTRRRDTNFTSSKISNTTNTSTTTRDRGDVTSHIKEEEEDGTEYHCDGVSNLNKRGYVLPAYLPHNTNHSAPSAAPTSRAAASMSAEAYCSFMELLRPNAQAACRMASKDFALAFESLVEKGGAAVFVRDTSVSKGTVLLELRPITTTNQIVEEVKVYKKRKSLMLGQESIQLSFPNTPLVVSKSAPLRVLTETSESTSYGPSTSGKSSSSAYLPSAAAVEGLDAMWKTCVANEPRLLQSAPATLTSPHLGNASVVINLDAVVAGGRSRSKINIALSKPRHGAGPNIHILDGTCANLEVQSVEFIGTSKVVSIGNGFLAGSFAESVSFGAMPRLRSVGDDWMFLCSRLREVTVDGTCGRLRTVGSRWLSECQLLSKFDPSAFSEVERVGSWWLSRCDSLEAASFCGMPSLVTVGDWWMSSCPALERVSFEGQASLTSVGSGWLYAAVSIASVSFSGLLSLREVGDRWMADCTWLRSVSHNGLVMLREVGSYWLSGCCMLERVSMLGVDRLTMVGPYWLANTCAPHVECNSANSSRVSALIDLSHDVLTQRGRIDPKMRIQLLDEILPACPSHLLHEGSSSTLLPTL